MSRLRSLQIVAGLCVGLAAGPALAQTSPLVGLWHWNRAQSTLPPGEPVPNDLTIEIARADNAHLKWSLTAVPAEGVPNVETFDAPANGEFYPVSSDTTASFQLKGGALQATFKGPAGQSDDQTCSVSPDKKKLTCQGVLSEADGTTAKYVDVYDRM
jgi:hypothetical protein